MFLVDAGLGRSAAIRTLFQWLSARFLTEAEYRRFPGLTGELRFTGQTGFVNVLLELRRPLADETPK